MRVSKRSTAADKWLFIPYYAVKEAATFTSNYDFPQNLDRR